MGWTIVAHSFALLFRNLGAALKVSLGPFAVTLVFGALAVLAAGGTPAGFAATMAGAEAPPALALAVIAALVAVVFASAWVAIAWHRFVLAEENPSFLPQIPRKSLGGYVWRSFTLGLMMVVVAFPLSAMGGVVMTLTGLSGLILAELLVAFVVATALSYLWLRMAIVLPAVAMGRPLLLSQAWAAGAPYAGEILKAAAILVGLNLVITRMLELIAFPLWISAIAQLGLSWITIMAGTSILTTLYGVLIEKRSLT